MKSKKYLIIPLIVAAAFLAQPIRSWGEERYTELQNFSKILNLIQQYYVDPVDTKKLITGAIKGMLRELDPHTNYMPVDIFKDFESETAGEFGGIGIEISVQNNILTIISPIEDTPAWKAGIKPGDRVVAIDGQSTKGFTLVEASALLKGKNGDPIVLSVIRDNSDKPLDIRIVRGQVKLKSVKAVQLDNGYLYVRITSFIESTSKELEKVLADYSKGKKMEGILMDLRKNPGGLLDQAIKVSDLFIKEGVIVSTIGRDPKSKEVSSATKTAPYPEVPIVVLINEYSASASEIVSGALQDNKRAVIVGERSFGKGSVQSVIKLGDGSGLKLTVARYYTPSGVSIQSEGIKPDIEIEEVDSALFAKAITDKKSQREKDIAGHLKSENEKKKMTKAEEKASKSRESRDSMAWWKDLANKKDNDLSESEKLFKSDYQAYQAYSYLKAWKTLKKFN